MSYLLFLDESGHDHKNLPYEVHGGIAIHASRLWSFIRAMKSLEQSCFGDALHNYGSEIKGMKLLNKDRFKWANQEEEMDSIARRKHALRFLNDSVQGKSPKRASFTAYGQSSLEMVHGIFGLLQGHGARVFAVAIPRGVPKPEGNTAEEFLRKDLVFLLERYFRFLEENDETGLLVMDETDASLDRNLVRKLEAYFSRTTTGKARSARIVPSPLFVSSDMTYPVQAADVCIYCINWGFRIPQRGMNAAVRSEVADFSGYLGTLQHRSEVLTTPGTTVQAFSIAFVPDPYTPRTEP